jgi:hypothetical protein
MKDKEIATKRRKKHSAAKPQPKNEPRISRITRIKAFPSVESVKSVVKIFSKLIRSDRLLCKTAPGYVTRM